jgi:hypothetical protein
MLVDISTEISTGTLLKQKRRSNAWNAWNIMED